MGKYYYVEKQFVKKYYAVYFDENANDMTIFEDKFLSVSKYTQIDKEKNYILSYVDYEFKKIEFPSTFCCEPLNFQGFSFMTESCCYCNDCEKDGFMYDRENERIVYGYTPVYVRLEGDSFVDVVTGTIIPRSIIKKITEIDTAELLSIMADDLLFISKYVNIYSEILKEWLIMLSYDSFKLNHYNGMHELSELNEYNSRYEELVDFSFEEMKKQIANDDIVHLGQYQRVKKLINNLKKSSNS